MIIVHSVSRYNPDTSVGGASNKDGGLGGGRKMMKMWNMFSGISSSSSESKCMQEVHLSIQTIFSCRPLPL